MKALRQLTVADLGRRFRVSIVTFALLGVCAAGANVWAVGSEAEIEILVEGHRG